MVSQETFFFCLTVSREVEKGKVGEGRVRGQYVAWAVPATAEKGGGELISTSEERLFGLWLISAGSIKFSNLSRNKLLRNDFFCNGFALHCSIFSN